MGEERIRVLSTDIISAIGQDVLLRGWVDRARSHGKLVFFDLRDRKGIVQVVVNPQISEEAHKKALELRPQDVVQVVGLVNKRPSGTENKELETGAVELEAKSIDIISKAETLPFDVTKKELDLELPTLLDYRSLTLRHPKIKAIFKVQEVVVDAFRQALKAKDFTEFQAPVVIPQAAEGGAEVFEVKYFSHKAFLAQSPQFYKQIMVGVFERVFTVNKTLRAEPSVTTRHLTEATTLDAEFGFIQSWQDLMDMAEYVIKFILGRVEKECLDTLSLYGVSMPKVSEKIPRIKLRKAQEIIFNRTGRDVRNEPDLSPEDEREISRYAMEEQGSELVFVSHYPVDKRPFYTFEDPEDKGYTLSFDLIGKGIEWLTGGQRINTLEKLTENAKKRGVDLARSELYLQAFRYGMPPEGGFSFGSERIVMSILGLSNIREACAFPRDMERVDVRLQSLSDKNKKD